MPTVSKTMAFYAIGLVYATDNIAMALLHRLYSI